MITLKEVSIEDSEILYELLKERSTENDEYINISHRQLPSYKKHLAFIQTRPYAIWNLIMDGKEPIGSISLTWRNEIGIVLFKKHRGEGYGKMALSLFLDTYKPLPAVPSERNGNFLANINPKNKASITLFQSVGFKHIQNTYEL